MLCLSVLLGLLWAVQGVLAGDMTSFLSVNAQRYTRPVESQQIASLTELLLLSNSNEPLIVLQFDEFDLLADFDAQHSKTYPFLSSFFKSSSETVLKEQQLSSLADGFSDVLVLKLGEIPASASEFLRQKFNSNDRAVVVEFESKNYDVAELDDFLETMYVFMEDAMKNIDNVVLRVPGSDVQKANKLRSAAAPKDVGVDDPEKPPVNEPEDPDALSSLWTEGLLSCLLISLLLISILVVAISWVASIDISYGALQKTTNPLKKTN